MANNIIPKESRFKLIASIYILLIENGKILLLRRCNTGFEDGNYGLVAGHVDGCETMREAMVREAREEAGIILDKNDLDLALTMHRWCGDHERVDLFFTTRSYQGEIINTEPDKCDDLSWFDINHLPLNTIDYIRYAIECYKKGEKYCEFGWKK